MLVSGYNRLKSKYAFKVFSHTITPTTVVKIGSQVRTEHYEVTDTKQYGRVSVSWMEDFFN